MRRMADGAENPRTAYGQIGPVDKLWKIDG
jgi:hypothetical protein